MKNFKKDFPIFKQKVNGKPLVYLDSAATSQKPQTVIDAINDYYSTYNANVRRGLYPMSEKATAKVEEVREKVRKFINARSIEEIIFVRNATEAINLVAYSFASHNIKAGDVITTTLMEHHSNFVPWQQIAKDKKAKFDVLDIDNNYHVKFSSYNFKNTKLLAITHVSNVLGTINPVKEIIKAFRKQNPKGVVLVDAAQSVPHMSVDVGDLDCDFLVFSGHKMMAGTGVGVLYGKKEVLENMPPFLYGGEMIREVGLKSSSFAPLPQKFESGTPSIADIISLGTAIDYLEKIGMGKVREHERKLMAYGLSQMKKIKGIKIYGPTDLKNRGGVISFTLENIHPHDVGQILGELGVCVRAGHHCTMPLHRSLGLMATTRASFYIYNDEKDIDALIKGLLEIQKMFRKK